MCGRARDDKDQAAGGKAEDQEKGRVATPRAEARSAGLAGRKLLHHLVAEQHVRPTTLAQEIAFTTTA
jgi:hypothetical protein